jgi:indolepyruvate ferredoxin oxidoreductase, beta subunit
MKETIDQQIVVSGVGGQGVLFITRLLAEAAVAKGFRVLTSETHGMAQRGGSVVSHLKVGGFFSPLIRPATADGLLALASENLSQNAFYLKPGGWTVVNKKEAVPTDGRPDTFAIDAEKPALALGAPKSVNLILLGFAMATLSQAGGRGLFCSSTEIEAVIERRLKGRKEMFEASLNAFRAGFDLIETPRDFDI